MFDIFTIAEGILIANVDCDPMAGNPHGCLFPRPRGKSGEGNFQPLVDPGKSGGDEFAERDQMLLVVALPRRGTERDSGIVVGVLRAGRRRIRQRTQGNGHADDQIAAILRSLLFERIEIFTRDFVDECRQRGFRQHNQPGLAGFHHRQIVSQRSRALVFAPFHLLFDISLQQRDRERRTGGRTPVYQLHAETACPQDCGDCGNRNSVLAGNFQTGQTRNADQQRAGGKRQHP
jgi:hypothetical protein